MLNENIKIRRKAKGMSQEELATKLNISRQTLSKWEKGLSVPDAEILIRIADALDTSVSELLGEACSSEVDKDTIKTIAAKLEILNQQYAKSREQKRKIWRVVSIALAILGIVYLVDRVWTAGTIFRAMTNPHLGADTGAQIIRPDIPNSLYAMLVLLCARMILPPMVICTIAAIGIYKTKMDA
ncbi:MAG: helix-turn-helix domain-containing protein [Roseburia sp.]|nr:helix-turn-helix domain-containing protein [Roseburia sp.]